MLLRALAQENTMSQTNESSVLFALKELQRLEADRIAEEDRRAAEARLRVEADLRAQEADAERRIATLRAEIDAVRADRERLHARIVTAAAEPEPIAKPAIGKRIAMVSFGFASLTALALSIYVATRPPVVAPPRIVEVQVPAPQIVPEPAAVEPVVEAPVVAEPEVVAERPRPTGVTMRHNPTMQTESMSDMRLDLIDRCGDDPLCGTDLP
jgi:hypothetical protein